MTEDEIVFSQLQKDVLHDLWGMGFTIVRRKSSEKLFDEPRPPHGMAYQWMDRPNVDGWVHVDMGRHPGMFAPYGVTGSIVHSGMWLMERSAAEVKAFHDQAIAKANKNVEDWIKKHAGDGAFGSVTILKEGSSGVKSVFAKEIGEGNIKDVSDDVAKTIERDKNG